MRFIVVLISMLTKMLNNKTIYLDNASNTLIKKEVIDTYQNAINTFFANPSSIHKEGQIAYHELNKCHDKILSLLKVKDDEVIYTSGATEANNLAIKGYCFKYQNRGKHIITSSIEHPSVLEVFRQLEDNFGFDVTYINPNSLGYIEPESVKKAIRNDTILVSVMAVNNETGAINPIKEIAEIIKQYPKISFHVDAVQAVGKIDIDYQCIDMITIAGHKIHGLIGSGLLIKRKKINLLPLLAGGGQENGFRSGTSDLANLLAISKALELSLFNLDAKRNKILEFKKKLVSYLLENPDLYEINSYDKTNPYIVNFSLLTKKASVIVEALSNVDIMVSSISACHSRNEKGSYVIRAMGKNENLATNTIRVSFDEENTIDDVNALITNLDKIAKEVRSHD